ncbi:hypothetical protein CY35_04G017100 [Sphagnum magellanicum]|nr:hypothetical protein CY35_04G017100 [Sphagnum magellanicum]
MLKDSLALVPDDVDAKLESSSNYHLWKYMLTQVANKEGLLFILEADRNKGKGAVPSNLDEKKESLLYIMTRSIKSGLLGNNFLESLQTLMIPRSCGIFSRLTLKFPMIVASFI